MECSNSEKEDIREPRSGRATKISARTARRIGWDARKIKASNIVEHP